MGGQLKVANIMFCSQTWLPVSKQEKVNVIKPKNSLHGDIYATSQDIQVGLKVGYFSRLRRYSSHNLDTSVRHFFTYVVEMKTNAAGRCISTKAPHR